MVPFRARVTFLFIWSIPLINAMGVLNLTELQPTLELKSYNFFVKDRNITQNETHVRIPKVFNELIFQCNSPIPTKWVFEKDQINDSTIKDLEISKWRFWNESTYLFFSTLKIVFTNPDKMLGIVCENTCPKEVKPCGGMSTHLTHLESSHESPAFFELQYEYGNKTKRTKEVSKVDLRLGRNPHCLYTLHVDMETGKYACTFTNSSGLEAPSILIPCRNPDECDIFYKNNTEKCETVHTFQKDCPWDFCYEMKVIYSPFILACGEVNPNSVARIFVRTLMSISNGDKKIYEYHRKNATFDKMHQLQIEMNMSSGACGCQYGNNTNTIYTKYTREFICTGLRSFFSSGFRWIIKYKNKTEKDLGLGKDYVNETCQLYVSRKTIYFDVSSIVEVFCEAPNWNSLHGINISIRVKVQESVPPCSKEHKHLNSKDNTTYVVVHVPLRNSNENETLSCSRTGIPPAIISWYFDGDKPEGSMHKHYTLTDDPDKSVVILQPGHRYNDVMCLSSNAAGSAKVHFKIMKDTGAGNIMTMILVCAFAGIIVVVVVFIAVWKIRKQRETINLTEEEIEEFHNGKPDAADAFLVPYNMDLEVLPEHFSAGDEILGSGAYGKVVKGHYGVMDAAIKTLKPCCDVTYLKALLSELKIMSFVGRHPNIVNLLGACTQNIRKKEIFIILEFCERGDMVSLLRKNRNIFINYFESESIHAQRTSIVEYQNKSVKKLSTMDLLRWCVEIARGMEFLSNKNVIHGDLAGRNILITECLNAKVSDFGLAKQLFDYSTYVQKVNVPLPLRWMAYESLKDLQFSVQSDIWSYGVVLWEIFSLGETPYPGMEWGFESWKEIFDGMRNDKPCYASDAVYAIMYGCWNLDPQKRPGFKTLWKSILDYSNELQGHFGEYVL
ncbi:unnamed protein product [Allacma fusca]|uniref:receptor protein-tyrosine kinase n=1 Tax=Allacma fusca TaxID=39272 RepID=A0A8J2NPM4_9HEXA|nr:unnamed protein product [Allacma fusca]